jgi:hypothetical protein
MEQQQAVHPTRPTRRMGGPIEPQPNTLDYGVYQTYTPHKHERQGDYMASATFRPLEAYSGAAGRVDSRGYAKAGHPSMHRTILRSPSFHLHPLTICSYSYAESQTLHRKEILHTTTTSPLFVSYCIPRHHRSHRCHTIRCYETPTCGKGTSRRSKICQTFLFA